MKYVLLTLIGFLAAVVCRGQEPVGSWSGFLQLQGQQLQLVFNISNEGGQLSATMDIPAQGAKGLKADDVSYTDSVLKLTFNQLGIGYEGILQAGGQAISGSFQQSGLTLPLELGPHTAEAAAVDSIRPQEPKPPYPYQIEDVTFSNPATGNVLAGTLTYPDGDGPFPAAILISGSGPQNRDGEIVGHKPFLVIADYLTRRGIAVLRYDDRGVGGSTGDFSRATSRNFADDAAAAFRFLTATAVVDSSKIGFIGHSEGGMVAPMVAAEHKDVAFLVLLAAPGLPIDSFMVLQNQLIGKAAGMNEPALAAAANANRKVYALLNADFHEDTIHRRVELLIRQTVQQQDAPAAAVDTYVDAQLATLFSPWYRYFIAFDPQPVLRRVQCPVLALNGDKDTQVGAKENLASIQAALEKSGNPRVETKTLKGLNHLFQTANSGLPSEYRTIEETMAPEVLAIIVEWIGAITNRPIQTSP